MPALPPPGVMEPLPLWRLLLDAALFGLAGIVLLIVGYYLWELITPYNLRREIENKNTAAAIVVAAFIIGMAIVIAASLILIK
jgi:putative membrane protein